MEMVNHGGLSYWVPISDRNDQNISSIAKWEEAFHIYTEGNPSHAIELIQYNHITHEAALDYPWDSVYAYDHEFRIHMSKYPNRNWGIILQQAWTLKMKRSYTRGNGNNGHGGSTSRDNGTGSRSSRRNICWKFNQGRCTYGISCKFEHKCAICNKWGHRAVNCR